MLQKKVCMLGAFAVGKTSLVSRYVHSMFSEKYLTTVGVKIDKKEIDVEGRPLGVVLWDLHGEDHFQEVRTSYLRGMAGYLLVVDGTRQTTLDTALRLQERVEAAVGSVPFIAVLNKADLKADWEVDGKALSSLERRDWTVIETSAKTGEGVEEAFRDLAAKMLDR